MPIPHLITDRAIVSAVERRMDAERAVCRACQRGDLPRHFRSFIDRDGRLIQMPCGGNGRRYDPESDDFVGYPHCTCDLCF